MTRRKRNALMKSQRPNTLVLAALAGLSLVLGFYLLHSILASNGDLNAAEQEAGYTPPLTAQEAPTKEGATNPTVAGLVVFAAGMLIAIPLAGGAIYYLRGRSKSSNFTS